MSKKCCITGIRRRRFRTITRDTSTGAECASCLRSREGTYVAEEARIEQAEEPASRHRRGVVFATVSIALLLSSIDQTMVATVLPTLQQDLNASLSWAGWTVTVYALGQIIGKPLAGSLTQRFGQKVVFVCCIAVFTGASLCCALSTSIYALVLMRALQALGGGGLMPSGTHIVAKQFGRDRDRAVGAFASIVPIGAMIGPMLGGVIVTYSSWRLIFLVNVPVGMLLLMMALKTIPRGRPTRIGSTDLRGIALLVLAILAAMYGLTVMSSRSTAANSRVFMLSEIAAVVAIVTYLVHTKYFHSPLVPGFLLWGRGFALMNLLNLLYGAAVLGLSALVPLYAIRRYGLSSFAAGTLLTARAIAMILFASLALVLMRRTGHRALMVAGFGCTAGGLILISLPAAAMSPYRWLSLGAAVTGIGMGLASPSSSNAGLHLAPEQVATLAGLRGMFRQSGSIIAISLATTVISRAANQSLAQAYVFDCFAAALLVAVPLAFLIPDHRGMW